MKKIYLSFTFVLFAALSVSAQVVWDNFEDSRKGTYGFISGTFIPYGENPAPGGSNTSLVAAAYSRNPSEAFDVIILDAPMADLTDYRTSAKTMSIDVWSPAVGTTVQITLENSILAEPANYPTGRHSFYLATTTVAQQWETLTFNFVEQPDATVEDTNVDRIVLLFAPNTNTGDTYYWDNLNGPELANDPCEGVVGLSEVFNDFECNQNTNFTFSHSGVNFRRVLNPDPNGNPSEYAATYTRNAGELIDVIVGRFDGNLSLEADNTITMDVWDPAAPTPVLVSLQNENNEVIIEMTQSTSTSNAWQTLTFDPSSVIDATDISRFAILFDPNTETSDQYYWDNFRINSPTAITDLAEVTAFQATPNPSFGETTFQYNLETAAHVNLSIFDMNGKLVSQVLSENQLAGTHQATWLATDLPNGIYFYNMMINGANASGKIVLSK